MSYNPLVQPRYYDAYLVYSGDGAQVTSDWKFQPDGTALVLQHLNAGTWENTDNVFTPPTGE